MRGLRAYTYLCRWPPLGDDPRSCHFVVPGTGNTLGGCLLHFSSGYVVCRMYILGDAGRAALFPRTIRAWAAIFNFQVGVHFFLCSRASDVCLMYVLFYIADRWVPRQKKIGPALRNFSIFSLYSQNGIPDQRKHCGRAWTLCVVTC